MKTMLLKNKLVICLIGIGLMAALSSCSGKSPPDEFMVLKNPSLAIPPEFHLSPGSSTEDLDDVIAPQEIAKRALFGQN
jgi:hypothetical protein